jgi:hypothetical protein
MAPMTAPATEKAAITTPMVKSSRGELLLAPATNDANDHHEEPDDGVRPRGLLNRKPKDVQEHRDAELPAAHAD